MSSRTITNLIKVDGKASGEWLTRSKYGMTGLGKPTDEKLATWVEGYIESLKPGGVNAHISEGLGYIPVPNRAEVYNQKTGETVATWEAPAFLII